MDKKFKRFLLYTPGILLIFTAGAFSNYNNFMLMWGMKGEIIWIILCTMGIILNLRFTKREESKNNNTTERR